MVKEPLDRPEYDRDNNQVPIEHASANRELKEVIIPLISLALRLIRDVRRKVTCDAEEEEERCCDPERAIEVALPYLFKEVNLGDEAKEGSLKEVLRVDIKVGFVPRYLVEHLQAVPPALLIVPVVVPLVVVVPVLVGLGVLLAGDHFLLLLHDLFLLLFLLTFLRLLCGLALLLGLEVDVLALLLDGDGLGLDVVEEVVVLVAPTAPGGLVVDPGEDGPVAAAAGCAAAAAGGGYGGAEVDLGLLGVAGGWGGRTGNRGWGGCLGGLGGLGLTLAKDGIRVEIL